VTGARTTLDRFELMALMRAFEEACLEGVETGEIHGELHVGIGQEAIAAGMAESLQSRDAVVSTHRNHLHAIAKGVPLRPMLAEIFERGSGLCRGRGGHMHLFDPDRNFSCTGIVGSSLGVALGYAYAAWLEGHDAVGVGVTGDGGANTGAFHECLNIAGAWRLPYVVLVENNEYAISVPIAANLATATIAERAAAYTAWGRRVDGTDPDAVAAAFAEAVEYARSGHGPALLEATCYRFRGHYEGDFDLYRPKDEKEAALRDRDPLMLTGRRLLERGEATQAELDETVEQARRRLSDMLAEIRTDAAPDPRGALDYVFVQ
jgi:acetoin:2,6-dichlorophenolindophenol oxidoreductase subunit alpha